MSLMERFANPDTIGSLSFSDKMTGSLITMVMGMGTTFVVLILLWALIAAMSKLFVSTEKRGSAGAAASSAGQSAAAPAPAGALSPQGGDGELAAVVAAAIAAFEGSTGADGLIVRRIRRVSGQANAWNDAGRSDCVDSRKM